MKTISPIQTFAENLNYLRISSGMSQSELAEKIGVSDKTILRYESGQYNPNMSTVASLAEALNVRIEDFFNENLQYDILSNSNFNITGVTEHFEDFNYREGFKIPSDLKESIKNITIERLIKINELHTLLNVDIKFVNPLQNFKTIKSKEDAEKAALKVRKKWNLGNSPILSVINTLENQGINVIEFDAPEEFEGLSAYINEIPIIVLNKAITEKTRRRFTALHELGHLILTIDKELDYQAMEHICDAFAAAMLIPKELLIVELGNHRTKISKEELTALKKKYGISVNALLVGAAFSRIIDWDNYHEMKKEYILDLGEYQGEEKATKYDQLVYRGIVEGQISPGKANYFGMDYKKFKQTRNNAYESWKL